MISKITTLRFSLLPLALAAAGIACSSGPAASTKKPAGEAPVADAGAAAANDAAAPTGLGARPCTINSGYAGDDKCILAPDPALGFQFHYGPSDYNDPAEVQKYTLDPGKEVTDCVFFPTPNTTDVYFNEYHSRMRPGSHHMLLYIQPIPSGSTVRTSTAPEACNQGAKTRNLFGAQTPVLDTSSLAEHAPEDDGLAVKIPATQQAVMQLHFVNVGTAPLLREGWANIIYTDPAKVTTLGDPIFFIGGYGMKIMMGQTQTLTGHATVPAGVDPSFRLIIGTGHYHTHTTRFTAWATVSGQKQVIIDEFNPLHHLPEPSTFLFTSVNTNVTPDSTTGTSGAYSGVLKLQPGDRIDWQCEVTNDDVSPNSPAPNTAAALTFDNAVYTGEMCNMFGMYAPSIGGPWNAECLVSASGGSPTCVTM
jgi:hypothetical protein